MTQKDSEQRLEAIEFQLEQITNRNLKVATDKAWETSKFRIISICILTYFTISLVFWMIGIESFLINAIIPTLGFFLSTQSLPILKKFWVKCYFKN